MGKKIQYAIGAAIFLMGCLLFWYPDIAVQVQRQQADEYIRIHEAENAKRTKDKTADSLWRLCRKYNEKIVNDGQKEFTDPWSVTVSPIEDDELKEGRFGCIKIPAMNVTLPLYIGATDRNMAKGAVILGGTSLPVGGKNTNCVIAAHRGYRGIPFFREIEKLKVGDVIYVVNPWETLIYRVQKIKIIDPDDSDEVKIRKGKDLITLMTCHPYRSHGRFRYLVFCEHTGNMKSLQNTKKMKRTDTEKQPFFTDDISRENTIRRICGAAICMMAGTTIAVHILCGRKQKF